MSGAAVRADASGAAPAPRDVLVLGGTGRLYGALIGASVFIIAQDRLAGLNPVYWQFWVGLLLIVVVLVASDGILGGLARARRRWTQRRHDAGPA